MQVAPLLRKLGWSGVGFVAAGVMLVPLGLIVGLAVQLNGRASLLPWLPLLFGPIFIYAGIDALRRRARGRRLCARGGEAAEIWTEPDRKLSKGRRARTVAVQTREGGRLESYMNGPASSPRHFQAEGEPGLLYGTFAHGQWVILACDSGACMGRLERLPEPIAAEDG